MGKLKDHGPSGFPWHRAGEALPTLTPLGPTPLGQGDCPDFPFCVQNVRLILIPYHTILYRPCEKYIILDKC